MNTITVFWKVKKNDYKIGPLLKFANALFFLILINANANQNLLFTTMGSSLDSSRQIDFHTVEMRGTGTEIRGDSENCIFGYGLVNGDFTLSAQVTLFDPSGRSEAGLMLRNDTAAASPMLALVVTSNRTLLKYRLSSNCSVSTVVLSDTAYPYLQIQRIGDEYVFLRKIASEMSYAPFPSSYSFLLQSALVGGFCHSSGDSLNMTVSRFDGISGLHFSPEVTCQNRLYDFNTGFSLDSMGFAAYQYWVIDSAAVKSTTPGGTTASYLKTSRFSAMNNEQLTIEWSLRVEPDSASVSPVLTDYGIYGTEGVTLRDRVSTFGKVIGSGTGYGINIWNDCEIEGEIRSGDSVSIGHRTQLTGDLYANGTVTIGSGTQISGSVFENQNIACPVIPVKVVQTSSIDIQLGNYDSLDLVPGNYGRFSASANSKIRFSPGVYNFSRFWTEPDVEIYLNNDTGEDIEINVRDTLRFGDRNSIIPDDSSLYESISIYCHQNNDLHIGTDFTFFGYFHAPRAKLQVTSRNFQVFGGIYAKVINFESDSRLQVMQAAEHKDVLRVSFNSPPLDSSKYSLSYHLNRSSAIDTGIQDLFFYKEDSLFSTGNSQVALGNDPDIRFRADFLPDSQFFLYVDKGNGLYRIVSSHYSGLPEISSLSFLYTTGTGAKNNSVFLDDISVSCANEICRPTIVSFCSADKMVYPGENVHFTVELAEQRSYGFQWMLDGEPIEGAVHQDLFIKNVTVSDSGSYSCRITSVCDTNQSCDIQLSVLPCSPPLFNAHPVSAIRTEGDSVSFSVNVRNGLGLSYQWLRGAEPVGVGGPVYFLERTELYNNQDEYRVRVTTSCGSSALSDSAVLTVHEPTLCKITEHPGSFTAEPGDTAFFEVRTQCDSSRYFWLRNDQVIPGANGIRLYIDSVTRADSGSVYKCIVHNGSMADTSDEAVLYVVPPKQSKRLLAISGKLLDGNGNRIGRENAPEPKNFIVKLYTAKMGGEEVYSEVFEGDNAVLVRSGRFNIQLGQNRSEKLQEVMTSYDNLFAELYAAPNRGYYELLGPRLMLTTSAYAMSTAINAVYGGGSPEVGNVVAPIGTLYVDRSNGYRTWKMSSSGWIALD